MERWPTKQEREHYAERLRKAYRLDPDLSIGAMHERFGQVSDKTVARVRADVRRELGLNGKKGGTEGEF